MYHLISTSIQIIKDRHQQLRTNPEEGAINTLEMVVMAALVVSLLVVVFWPQIQALISGWFGQIPTSF